MNKYKDYKEEGRKKLKSILKGFQSEEEEEPETVKVEKVQENKKLTKSQVVHPSVNNYMTTPTRGTNARYTNSRPQSSDMKEK